MEQKTLLKIVLIIALAGLLFSGYLSFVELSGKIISCPAVTDIFKIPTCVYGFVMYAIIFALVLFILIRSNRR